MSDLRALIEIVKQENYVVLDTETTGLYEDAQIVQIAVIDPEGAVLLDSLVHPTCPIPLDATTVHGITSEMVANAPCWADVFDRLCKAIDGKDVIIYNADYDRRLIFQTCEMHAELLGNGAVFTVPIYQSVRCAMLAYAEYYREWDDYHGNYRWQRLERACQRHELPSGSAHTALGDCQMTLALIKKITELEDERIND